MTDTPTLKLPVIDPTAPAPGRHEPHHKARREPREPGVILEPLCVLVAFLFGTLLLAYAVATAFGWRP